VLPNGDGKLNTTTGSASGSAVLSAVLVHGDDNLTSTALNSGASKALKLARQYDWRPDESRRFSVTVTCRNVKYSLSYVVTFGYPK